MIDIINSVARTALDVLPIAVVFLGFQIVLVGGVLSAWRKLIAGFVLVERCGISHAPVMEDEKVIGIVSYYLLVLGGLPDLDG